MKRLLPSILLFCSLACDKNPDSLLDIPEYKTMTAHAWKSDSVYSRASGVTTVSYSSPANYELLHFYYPSCGFVRYANGQIADSAKYGMQYQPGRLGLSPDTSHSGSLYNFAYIKLATDTALVLEHHTSPDSSVAVVTTYYHAR